MQTIKFYGASDDLVEVEGRAQDTGGMIRTIGEYSAWDNNAALGILAKFAIMVPDEDVPIAYVYAIYDGMWSFALAMADEDQAQYPTARVVRSSEVGYSMELLIEMPEGIEDAYVRREDGE